MSVRDVLRRWLGVQDVGQPGASDTARDLDRVKRQLTELRGLLHQQTDFTMEALRRAGWQDEDEAAQQKVLQRTLTAARGAGDVIVGPWTGEVGFELLYWIPFLGWLADHGLSGQRMVVISRGGAAPWYRHLTSRYVDALDLITPDEFRERTAGKKKQYDARREIDLDLIAKAKDKLKLGDVEVVHPSAMFRLFAALWRKRAAVELVESFASFRLLAPPPAREDEASARLPNDCVVAKFYFSKAFPDTPANRAFVTATLRTVSQQAPVALLNASVRLDEHHDFETTGMSGIFVVDSHGSPSRNLELQTRLIAGARGFVGTYGGFSYLAPFHGVPSLSFFSRRNGFETHHLDLANRVFDRLLPGGFLALDRRAADLVDPAVGRWRSRPGAETREPEVEGQKVAT